MIINPCGFPNCKSADCDFCPHNKIERIEDPIRILDELIKEAEQEPSWKADNALRCAKKEIEKILTPQKPEIMDDYTEEDGEELWISYYVCPKCFKSIHVLNNYCSNCGQPLDWNDYCNGRNSDISCYDERNK